MNKKLVSAFIVAAAMSLSAQVAPPGGLFVLNPVTDLAARVESRSVVLTWTDLSTGEDRYEVQVLKKWKNVSTVVALIPAPADSTRYVFGPLEPRTEYVFRVRPARNLTYTAFSNYVTVKTATTAK